MSYEQRLAQFKTENYQELNTLLEQSGIDKDMIGKTILKYGNWGEEVLIIGASVISRDPDTYGYTLDIESESDFLLVPASNLSKNKKRISLKGAHLHGVRR